MAIIILPDAQAQLLALQEYMLNNWSEDAWLKAEDEIFEKLEKVDIGQFTGTVVQERGCPIFCVNGVKGH